jgi:hydrogenase maturation protease
MPDAPEGWQLSGSRTLESELDPGQSAATVLGAGNWLIACDRVGPRVLESLEGRLGSGVEVSSLGTGGLALLDSLRGQELLVVVDACVGRGAPGDVLVVRPEAEGEPGPLTSVHQIGPLEALAICRSLMPERAPARVILVLVETSSLSPEAEPEAVRRATDTVLELIESWRRERSASS